MPAFGGSVRCGDRILGLRMKKEILSKYAHSCRSQSNSKVKAADFFVIAIDHIWKNFEFDLEFGYSRFGATLLSFDVGITQGSPLSPGLADMVLQAVENKQLRTFRYELKLWSLHVFRWADDILMVLVCLDVKKAAIDFRIRRKMDLKTFANETFSRFGKIYKETGLALKDEDPTTFAGFTLDWFQGCFATTSIPPASPEFDCKYQNSYTFAPKSLKEGVVVGLMIGTIDKTDFFTPAVLVIWTKQWLALVFAGYRRQLGKACFKIMGMNKKWSQ